MLFQKPEMNYSERNYKIIFLELSEPSETIKCLKIFRKGDRLIAFSRSLPNL
jgi:hypothetical protein